jgi:hypothetical protein
MTFFSMFAILGVWAAIAAIAWKHADHIKELCIAAVIATLFIAWFDAEGMSNSAFWSSTRSCADRAPGETAPSR